MFLRNVWYVAGWTSEFQPGAPVGRTIIDEPIVFFRTSDERLIALTDRCPHRWAPLSRGRVEGDNLRCMYHGVKFDAQGRCVEVPGQDRAAPSLCVRAFPIVERHRLVWIWMGATERADANLIPDASMLDEPNRRFRFGQLDYRANYTLINDNLLDLSHLAFVHENTLGRSVGKPEEDRPPPKIPGGAGAKAIERGVRVEGWNTGSAARTVVESQDAPDGDLWYRIDFLVPGIYISHSQMHAPGAAEACNGGPPNPGLEPLTDSMSIQAVTPLTNRTTRYFYSTGPRDGDMDEAEAEAIWNVVKDAFREDLAMIEAQQRILDFHPGDRMGGIAADRGLTLFRRLMKRLIAEESPLESEKDELPRPLAITL